MTGQCVHCTLRGDFAGCSATPCSVHDSWYAGQLRLALETATSERDEARRDLAASHREADRLRHGEAIESDYVCPESLRADKAEAERDAAVALIREVAASGVEFEDERISYTSVQIDRETWAAVRALAQKGAPE